MGIEEIRNAIAEVEQRNQDAVSQLGWIRHHLSLSTGVLEKFTQGSNDTSITEAAAQLQHIADELGQLDGRILAVTEAATSYAARL